MKRMIYDIETYINMFLAVFKDEDGIIYTFEISDRKNQLKELRQFLFSHLELVGFNNNAFDYPVLHNTILKEGTPTAEEIFFEASSIIREEWSQILPWEVQIPQIDLFEIKHYRNPARSTSLKWLEYAMRMEDIRDLPYSPDTMLDSDQMNEVLSYCIHDVNATEKFYHLCKDDIQLRESLSLEYDLHLINANDPKIGSEILLKMLSEKMGVNKKDLKKKRTYHNNIYFKDIILPYINFSTPELKQLLDNFKNFVSSNTKGDFGYTAKIGNIACDYGQGGIHGCIKPGVYKSQGNRIILDIDVKSYYPNLAINNNIRPKHLGESFSQIYKSIYELRKTFPKKDPRNLACKLMLNGSFGKMNSVYSFLYDPKALLGITVNGQLLLSMLMEKIYDMLPDITFLQANTDGFTLLIDKDRVDSLKNIVSSWEKLTSLEMEYAIYKSMIIRDVNNYMAIDENDYIKFKGAFEIDRDYHKNHSKRIVPLAIANYYINDIPIDDTINDHLLGKDFTFAKNYGIYDFCIGAKMKGSNQLFAIKHTINGNEETKLGKVTRYYVSNQGIDLIKRLPPLPKNFVTHTEKVKEESPGQMDIFDLIDDVKVDPQDRETNLESGHVCTVMNKYVDGPYDINKEYYINECNKIIQLIDGE